MDQKEYSRVEAFFEGTLSQEERKELLSELDQNEALRKEFDFQETIMLTVQEDHARAQKSFQPKVTPLWSQPRIILLAAALATLIVIAGFSWKTLFSSATNWNDLAQQIASADGYAFDNLKSGETNTEELSLWLREQDYSSIIKNLDYLLLSAEKQPQVSPKTSDSLYFLAVALTYADSPLQDLPLADSIFSSISPPENQLLSTWALRQRIAIALMNQDKATASDLLQKFSEAKTDPFLKKKADSILESMP